MAPDCDKIFFLLPGGDKIEISQLSHKVVACSLSRYGLENVAALQGVARSVTTKHARALPLALRGLGVTPSRGGTFISQGQTLVCFHMCLYGFLNIKVMTPLKIN